MKRLTLFVFMKINSFLNYSDYLDTIVNKIMSQIRVNEKTLIGIATGFSPTKIYSLIGEKLKNEPELRAKIYIFQLDEWKGVSVNEKNSCHYYIINNVIVPWKLDIKNCFMIDGLTFEDENQLIKYQKYLIKKSLDICILGIGENGHLALNEPGTKKNQLFGIQKLSSASLNHAMLEKSKQLITHGISIGIKEIMDSKEVILLISGENKQQTYESFITKKDYNSFPASILHNHQNCSTFIDPDTINLS